jgi:phenylalanine-4-hydroxylase
MSHLKQNKNYIGIVELPKWKLQNDINYNDKDQETWSYLYRKQLINLQDKATYEFLQNLALLKLPENHIPSLSYVSNILKIATGWEVVEVNDLIKSTEFFELLANKKFPSTTYIRSENELGISKDPDIFHELFGHVPMLMSKKHSHYIQKFGKHGLSFNEIEREFLQRVYWFSYETGLINTKNGIKIIGGSLLSSFIESAHIFYNKVVIKPFSLIEVLRTPYRADTIQNVYFLLNNIEELFNILDNVESLKNAINKAYYMGEYPAPFGVKNTKYESVGLCKYIIKLE